MFFIIKRRETNFVKTDGEKIVETQIYATRPSLEEANLLIEDLQLMYAYEISNFGLSFEIAELKEVSAD